MLLFNSKALLSQWKPRDAAVNFDAYRNLQRHREVLPGPCGSTALSCINLFRVSIETFVHTEAEIIEKRVALNFPDTGVLYTPVQHYPPHAVNLDFRTYCQSSLIFLPRHAIRRARLCHSMSAVRLSVWLCVTLPVSFDPWSRSLCRFQSAVAWGARSGAAWRGVRMQRRASLHWLLMATLSL